MRKKKQKSCNYSGTYYIDMAYISRKMYERNSVETIVDNDGIMWLNETHLEEGLDHKNLQQNTILFKP